MPRDLDKTFSLIKWVSSVVALQDHKNFSVTVKQRKYDKSSECLKKKIWQFSMAPRCSHLTESLVFTPFKVLSPGFTTKQRKNLTMNSGNRCCLI